MKLTNFFIKVDEFADYIPVVSTVTNLTNLFQKAIQPLTTESNFCKNHYYTYIQQKNTLRCVMLLIPILGNIVVGMFDGLLDYGKSDPSFLGFAPYRVRNDKKIILAVVKESGWALKYASENLKNDKDVVLAAVKNDGLVLRMLVRPLRVMKR